MFKFFIFRNTFCNQIRLYFALLIEHIAYVYNQKICMLKLILREGLESGFKTATTELKKIKTEQCLQDLFKLVETARCLLLV